MAEEQQELPLEPQSNAPIIEPEAPIEEPPLLEEGQEEAPPEEEMVEIEIDGKKYNIPRSIEESILRQEDYTQKTQAQSEREKQLDAEYTQLAERARIQDSLVNDFSELKGMESQLAQYDRVDWPTYVAENPKEANVDWMRFQQLQQLHGRKQHELAGKIQQFRNTSEQQRAEQSRATVEALRKADPKMSWPGHSSELMDKLTNYGREIGLTDAQMQRITDPVAIKILHGSYLNYEAAKKAVAQVQKPRVELQPVRQITSSRARQASTSGDELSGSAWLERERKREAAKRAAFMKK